MLSSLDTLEPYAPILIFMAIALGFSLLLIVLAYLRGARQPGLQKLAPYECGFEALDLPTKDRYENTARMKFDVRFYLVAILFIIFDLEIALLFPWAIELRELGWMGFGSVLLFLSVLTVGFAYEWKKGALEWA